MQETQKMLVQSLGGKDPLEKEVATCSSILAWKIPWTEEPGGLQFMESQRVRHDWATEPTNTHTHTHTHTSLKHLPLERPFRPFPQSTPLGHHRAGWAPCVYSSFPLAIYFTYVSVYMSVFVSQSVPPSLPPTVSTSPFSTSASLFLPCK